MPNIDTILKQEIKRLAKREIKAQLNPMAEKFAVMKKTIAEQKKEIASLKRELSKIIRKTGIQTKPVISPVSDKKLDKSRLSPGLIRKLREKLGLSRAQLALLIETSANTIYFWESGRTSPRDNAKAKLIQLRSLGKRQIKQLLEEAEAKQKKSEDKPVKKKTRKSPAKTSPRKTTAKTAKGVKKPAKAQEAEKQTVETKEAPEKPQTGQE